MWINIKGLTPVKKIILTKTITDNSIATLTMKETHGNTNHCGSKIAAMKVAEKFHEKRGSTILVAENIQILRATQPNKMDIEVFTIELDNCFIT